MIRRFPWGSFTVAIINSLGGSASAPRSPIAATVASQVVGPFLLTALLLDRLVRSAPSRVLTMSSGGMYAQKLDVGDLQFERKTFNGVAAYAQAKRAQVILTELWAEELAGSGVTVNAMHPGWADTPGVESALPAFYRVTRRLLRTPEEGADTIVWLAASSEAGEVSGKFWLDREMHPSHLSDRTRETAEERREFLAALDELVESTVPGAQASPKSTIFTLFSGCMKILAGLIS